MNSTEDNVFIPRLYKQMKYNQHIQVQTCSSTAQNKATEENKHHPKSSPQIPRMTQTLQRCETLYLSHTLRARMVWDLFCWMWF